MYLAMNEAVNSLGTTERVAKFVVATRFEGIPADAIKAAKGAVIDCLGCVAAGVGHPTANQVTNLVKSEGSKPVSGIIGSGFKSSALNAAFANGTIGHILDLDDISQSMLGHPSVSIIPAIFALAEELNLGGKDLLVAYSVGFEVAAKIGKGINIEHYERGWHNPLGSLGAAAASAKMLRLDVTQTRMALGICASLASGLRANVGTMARPFHAGSAAYNGVLAAKLAKEGIAANPSILEADQGFCDLFCGKENYNLQGIVEGIGDPFEIIFPGIIFKLYPSCSLTHPAIDIILDLKKERSLNTKKIRIVKCGVNYKCLKTLPYHSPKTGIEGKHSMEFCLAASITDGKLGMEQFTDEKVMDPEIQSLMGKIEVYIHPDLVTRQSLSHDFTLIEIELENGEKILRRAGKPKGDPLNPLSWDEIADKYRDCSRRILADQAVRESLDLLQKIDQLPEVTRVMNLLCKT